MPPRFTCFVLLAVLIVVLGGACRRTEWVEFCPADSSFSAWFPGRPKSTAEKLDLPIGYVEMHQYMAEDKSSACAVSLADYPGEYISEASVDVVLDGAQKLGLARMDGHVTRTSQSTFDRYTKRSFSFSAAGGQAHGSADLYLAGDRLYTVIAIEATNGTGLNVLSEKSDSFLHSFHILKSAPETGRPAPPLTWSVFSCSDGRFNVLMPHAPLMDSTVLPDSYEGTITQHTFHTAHAGLTFGVSYADFSVTPADERAAVDGACLGFASSIAGKVVRESDVTLQGHPGRDLYIECPTLDAYRVLIVQAKARLYMVMVYGPKAELATTTADRFLGSFALIGR